MNSFFSMDVLFVAAAVIFVGVALQEFLKEEGKLTPARKTWLRISLIFAAVGIALQFVRLFIR